jgi:rod shape-determining protein MreC
MAKRSDTTQGSLQSISRNLRDGLWEMIAPLARITAEARFRVEKGLRTYIILTETQKENERLRGLLAEKEFLLRHLKVLKSENERLREFLGFMKSSPLSLIPCKVTGAEAELWRRVYWVAKGQKDGVLPGAAVVTPKGVAGKVFKVSSKVSCFLPMTDERVMLDGAIAKNGIHGLVKGNGFDRLQFLYLPKDSGLLPGDLIVSSGLEGTFPEGMPIGRVIEVTIEGNRLFLKAIIEPAVSPFQIKEVFIVHPQDES